MGPIIRAGLGAAACLLPLALLAQSTTGPSFEVASVKPAATGERGVTSNSGDRIGYSNVSLLALIGIAYGVRGYQIDGPAWIRTSRYDVMAKFAAGTPRDQIPFMLQSLLADRFALKVHRETRDKPIYSLVFVKNSAKLQQAADADRGGWVVPPGGIRQLRKTKMAQFADILWPMVGRPVLDKTNLAGEYNFPLELSLEEVGGINASPSQPERPSIFTSVEELGLKLEPGKAPFEMIVVDGGSKAPTEN